MLGKIKGKRRGCQRTGWLDGITDAMDMNLGRLLGDGEGQGDLLCYSPWGCRVRHDWATEQQQEFLKLELLCVLGVSFLLS